MPKIRGFKADLWTDEDFVELSPWARLLWLGMWNYACDNGHLADKSKQIKMRVLPTDDVNCAELLRELEQNGRIVRENGVITIPNFARHQKPDKRYFQTCDSPGCTKPEGDSQRETRGAPAGTLRGSRGTHGDGDGEVKGSDGDGERSAASKSRKRSLPANWKPTPEHLERALVAGLTLGTEVDKFKAHAEANDRRAANWNAAFTQWLIKATEFRGAQPKPDTREVGAPVVAPPDFLTDEQLNAWYAEHYGTRA